MVRSQLRARGRRFRAMVWMLVALWVPSATAWGAPDMDGAIETLVAGPLKVAGDALGGVGLAGAAGCAAAGDLLSLADANPLTQPLLRGVASRTVHRLALALSWTSTGLLEGLRGEDIERLPEASATYLVAARGVGRLDTFVSGVRALGLAFHDGLIIPPLVILHLAGAQEMAERLSRRQEEARIDALGPTALPPEPEP